MSQFRNPRKVQLLPIATLLLAGCTGVIGAPGGSGENGQTGPGTVGGPGQTGGPSGTGPASDLTCNGGKIPASPVALHRLSPEGYANPARGLLGSPPSNPQLGPPTRDLITHLELETAH